MTIEVIFMNEKWIKRFRDVGIREDSMALKISKSDSHAHPRREVFLSCPNLLRENMKYDINVAREKLEYFFKLHKQLWNSVYEERPPPPAYSFFKTILNPKFYLKKY